MHDQKRTKKQLSTFNNKRRRIGRRRAKDIDFNEISESKQNLRNINCEPEEVDDKLSKGCIYGSFLYKNKYGEYREIKIQKDISLGKFKCTKKGKNQLFFHNLPLPEFACFKFNKHDPRNIKRNTLIFNIQSPFPEDSLLFQLRYSESIDNLANVITVDKRIKFPLDYNHGCEFCKNTGFWIGGKWFDSKKSKYEDIDLSEMTELNNSTSTKKKYLCFVCNKNEGDAQRTVDFFEHVTS